jgi:hypothetical protein
VPATIKYVAAHLRSIEDQQTTILDHFIGGADRTAGGILQAVTSAAQVRPTPTSPTRWNGSGCGRSSSALTTACWSPICTLQ